MPSFDPPFRPSESALNELRHQLTGTLHTPVSESWDVARMAWLVNVEQHPLAVLEVASREDIATAVRWALAHGVRIAVQPNGHGAGHDVASSLLLRTGRLDDIDIDEANQTVRIGAGVNSGQLSAALAGTGLAFLVGSNPDPSVVGLSLAGGLSWFGRAFGFGCDSIIGAEVIDGTGAVRQVSATHDPELFWALRGGGGDFAAVVSLELALHPAPAIYGGRLFWPIEQMGEVMRAFRRVCDNAPETFTAWYHTLQFPPFPEVPEPFRGQSFAMVAVAHLGERDEAEKILAPLRAVPGIAVDLLGELGVEAMAEMADEPTEPMPGMLRSTVIFDLDDATIERLVALVGPGTTSPLMMLQVRHIGGALSRPASQPSAHGPVDGAYNVQAIGMPVVPELVQPIMASLQQVLDAVEPHTTGRTLMNFLDHDQINVWWDAPTRARLQAVKRTTDPYGVFVSNRPVNH